MTAAPRNSAEAALVARMGVAHPGFAHKAVHWFGWRARTRAPGVLARVERELPLRPVARVRPASVAAEGVIPHVVHQTWIGDRFGRRHARALAAFRDLNPDYEFRLTTDAEADAFMRDEWGSHPIFPIYSGARFGPMKTDVWRYCALFSFGGVYCDINKALVAPIRDFVRPEDGAMLSFEGRSRIAPVADPAVAARMLLPDGVLANWLMAFRPGHPVLRELIDAVVRDAPSFRGRVSAAPKARILELTGPLQLTRALVTALGRGEADDVHQVGEEFDGAALWELRGSWVRFVDRPPYAYAHDAAILD